MATASRTCRFRGFVCALTLLAVNLAITAPLFTVEYSAYNGSIEWSFIAIARVMAEHPGEWGWWPLWNGGIPFELTYLPLLQWLVAAFSLLSGLSTASSFHIVTALVYVCGPVTLFAMAWALSRRLAASFITALAFSCLSLSALLFPTIRQAADGALSAWRLPVMVFWGGAPQTLALTLLPLAVVCFHRALTTESASWRILAGVLAACVALSNAFGAVMLPFALLCLLLSFPAKPWWKASATVAVIGVLSYCWVSPWLSSAMIRAMRASAATAGGDFRATTESWAALAIAVTGFGLLWLLLRRTRASAHLRFFTLLAYGPAAIVVIWSGWGIAILPQPHRYHLELDMTLLVAVVFGVAALADRLPKRASIAVAAAVIAALTVLTLTRTLPYSRSLVRSADVTLLSEYKIAEWMDRNLPGERAFISGSASFLYNVFTDNPQLYGGHEQHALNQFIPIVSFVIYSGMNAGARDAEYSVFWLKAFGARAVTVSGPDSTDYYKPFANPGKFEGVLPVLWRDGDDVIYGVPSRSASLAHVIPAAAVPSRRPIHGLDIEPVEPYVAALDDPRYPPAYFEWHGMSEAEIRASLQPGQVISVQIAYARGWEAFANGRRQPIRGDAIGQMVIEPDCVGPCEISLRYTGGIERTATRTLSLGAMLLTGVFVWRRSRRCR